MSEIKVEVVFTDGYQKRYTEAVAKMYQKKRMQARRSAGLSANNSDIAANDRIPNTSVATS